MLYIVHFHTSLPNSVLTYTQEIPLAQYFQQEEFLLAEMRALLL